MPGQPNVIVVNPQPENSESSQQSASDGNAELVRLAQEAAQATESNRQLIERANQLEAERESDRTRINILELQVLEMRTALEEEEEGQEGVTVITPPPPPPPPEPETPNPPKEEKGFFEKIFAGEW